MKTGSYHITQSSLLWIIDYSRILLDAARDERAQSLCPSVLYNTTLARCTWRARGVLVACTANNTDRRRERALAALIHSC